MDVDRIATIRDEFASRSNIDELCDALEAAQAENARHLKHINKIAAYLAINGYTWDELGETVVEILTDWKADYTAQGEHLLREEERGDRLAAIPTVYLHNLPPTWREGNPEPPPELHVMGTPECVAGLQAVIAERDRLASQVATLTTEGD